MFDFPGRPALPCWKQGLPGAPENDIAPLVLNIKSCGQWASFVVPKTMAGFLLRPHALDFQGPAAHWLDDTHVPLGEFEKENSRVLLPLAGPVLGPQDCEYGIMIVDYDAKRAWSMQNYTRISHLHAQSWKERPANHRAWVGELLERGHVRAFRLRSTGRVYDLPRPRAKPSDPFGWIEHHASLIHAKAHSIRGPARLDLKWIDLLLRPQGWDIADDSQGFVESFQSIIPDLAPTEAQAWVQWALDWRCDPDLSARLSEAWLQHRIAHSPADPAPTSVRARL